MKENGDIRGTREWAVAEINCSIGCPHGCLYCYARYDQVTRKGRVTDSQWNQCRDLQEEVERVHPLYAGQVMFPAAHDIVPENLDSCLLVIKQLLNSGNKILVVSKPHLNCVQKLCQDFYPQRDKILFRFTITARNHEILSLWEPGAPDYQERLMCLRSCYERGFATSVSIEPMLDREDVVPMIHELLPFVSHSIWIGKMNKIDLRVSCENEVIQKDISRIKNGQSLEELQRLYKEVEGLELIRWKESIKEVLGLDLATEPGQDI